MKKILLNIYFAFLASATFAQQFIADGRLPLSVIPAQVAGLNSPVLSLDGNWEINMSPVGNVWNNTNINRFYVQPELPFFFSNKFLKQLVMKFKFLFFISVVFIIQQLSNSI